MGLAARIQGGAEQACRDIDDRDHPLVSHARRADDTDHADHPGLMHCVESVRPKRVITIHGYTREFAAELRSRGYEAWSAHGNDQLEFHFNRKS